MRKPLTERNSKRVETAASWVRDKQLAERASENAATVFCKALNEIFAALGVATLEDALQEIEILNHRIESAEGLDE